LSVFFIPSIINRFGLSSLESNLLSAVPFFFGAICIVINSWHSDKTGERPLHLFIPFAIQIAGWAAVGVSFYSFPDNLPLQLSLLTLTVGVHFTFVPIFWAWLTQELKGGTTVAVSTAFVASFGTLGSIFTPYLAEFIEKETHNYMWVLIVLACIGGFCLLVGIMLVILLKCYPSNEYDILNDDQELNKKKT